MHLRFAICFGALLVIGATLATPLSPVEAHALKVPNERPRQVLVARKVNLRQAQRNELVQNVRNIEIELRPVAEDVGRAEAALEASKTKREAAFKNVQRMEGFLKQHLQSGSKIKFMFDRHQKNLEDAMAEHERECQAQERLEKLLQEKQALADPIIARLRTAEIELSEF